VNETAKLETLLGGGGEVRLDRHAAHEVLQKLKARGAAGAAAHQLEARLGDAPEVVLPPHEAHDLLEELRASGRRWVFGTEAPRERPSLAPRSTPEREPEPPRRFRRFWRS
jgi:predicted metal-dependent phosphoesterase TrpH